MISEQEILRWAAEVALDCEPEAARVPTPARLADWLKDDEASAGEDAAPSALSFLQAAAPALNPTAAAWGAYEPPPIDPVTGAVLGRVVTDHDGSMVRSRTAVLILWIEQPLRPPVPDGWRSAMTIRTLYAAWLSMPEKGRPECPIVALVRAWLAKPFATKPFIPKNRGSLPRLDGLTNEDSRLPDLPSGNPQADDQPFLPGFGPTIEHCASWLLWLYDRAGGESMMAGRGAPWDLRLFIGALLHLGIAEWDGQWRTLRFPHLREHEADWPIPNTPSIERWLHPNGWSNRRRDWHNLPEAFHRIARLLGYVPVDGGRIQLLFPSVIPDRPDFPLVEFTVRLPPSVKHGDRLDWPRLCGYGTESALLYRAYLAVTAHLGRSARNGLPLTRTLPAPVLGPDGKPMRRKGGRIVRSKTELIPNRHAHYVPWLADADLARMIGFDGTDKRRRHDARRARDRLEKDGVIEVETRRGGTFRLFGPAQKGKGKTAAPDGGDRAQQGND